MERDHNRTQNENGQPQSSERIAFESFAREVEQVVGKYICADVADRSVRVQRTLNAVNALVEQLSGELKVRAAAN